VQATPALMPIADERVRMLHVPGSGTVILPWQAALTLPGYAQTFARIDALIKDVMTQPPDSGDRPEAPA
jgi:hypothetical protein